MARASCQYAWNITVIGEVAREVVRFVQKDK